MAEPVKTRIVVADDDVDILDLLVFKLNQAGFETTAVPDGLAALKAIEADPPRLAILDVTAESCDWSPSRTRGRPWSSTSRCMTPRRPRALQGMTVSQTTFSTYVPDLAH